MPGPHVLEPLAVRLAGPGVALEPVEGTALEGHLGHPLGPLHRPQLDRPRGRHALLHGERPPEVQAGARAGEVPVLLDAEAVEGEAGSVRQDRVAERAVFSDLDDPQLCGGRGGRSHDRQQGAGHQDCPQSSSPSRFCHRPLLLSPFPGYTERPRSGFELRGESGQALLLALGASLALVAAALALVAIAGAVTGKGRAQRAADLAAISAARSMRDDLPRLLSPALLPDGTPNPRHLGKAAYLARARAAARAAGAANGVARNRVRIAFPDRASFAPVRAEAVISASLSGAGADRVEATAVAEAGAPSAGGGLPQQASGGGYGGPLVYRQGEGMRPDVAAAFDRMAAAAAADGLALVVNSGFRSDAEQAALFAAHPDPRWVAPPGHSLHRCATELDLGPSDAYGWLAANAGRFGFVQRYSWEPWHYGYDAGPAPCSRAGDAVGAEGDGSLAGDGGLPSFVPERFRAPLLRAAARWNVSAALLAAQLMAESNFNPFAVSAAGAEGIAQFIPSTAASYGLRDPFDAGEAIEAQAHLMSDLIRQLGSPQLALAAYNAGPAPVEACGCVPAIPETTAYVSRILALLGGAGALVAPSFEVRLVA